MKEGINHPTLFIYTPMFTLERISYFLEHICTLYLLHAHLFQNILLIRTIIILKPLNSCKYIHILIPYISIQSLYLLIQRTSFWNWCETTRRNTNSRWSTPYLYQLLILTYQSELPKLVGRMRSKGFRLDLTITFQRTQTGNAAEYLY